MKFTSTYQEQPTTPEQIREAERRMGVELPEEYKQYLLSHQGGHPDPDVFRVKWSGQDWAKGSELNSVAWFLAPHDGKEENLLDYYETHRDRIPKDTIPIARDPGSNLVLLGISGPNRGKVFFWRREYEAAPWGAQEADYSNVGFVANSFREFIDSLFAL
ncbi:MAG TPA: SMI1/KNR4 family protein [Pyrinomonadaceae bacterium]|jgi:hypothetical protein